MKCEKCRGSGRVDAEDKTGHVSRDGPLHKADHPVSMVRVWQSYKNKRSENGRNLVLK